MIREYLDNKKITIKTLSLNTGIPYSTLNDIINGKTGIEMIRFGYAKRIAKELDISLDELSEFFADDETQKIKGEGEIIVKNKCYYLCSEFSPNPVYLCKVNRLNKKYISEIASWEYEALSRKEMFKKWESRTSI